MSAVTTGIDITKGTPEINRYLRAVAMCNDLAMLASQGTMKEFLLRFAVLSQLHRLWSDGQSCLKVVMCSEDEVEIPDDGGEELTLSSEQIADGADDGNDDEIDAASDSTVEIKPSMSDTFEQADDNVPVNDETVAKKCRRTPLKPEMHSCNECGEEFRTKTLLRKHVGCSHRRKRKSKKLSGDVTLNTDAIAALRTSEPDSDQLLDTVEDLIVACHEIVPEHESSDDTAETEETKSQMCYICGRLFKSVAPLNLHLADHAGAKTFSCYLCGARYTRKSDMKRHMFKHYDEKMFSCHICSKQFTYQNSLHRHLQLHSGIRQYECCICGHKSATRGGLNVHMHTHSIDKTYKCKRCLASFKHPSSLSRHMQTCST